MFFGWTLIGLIRKFHWNSFHDVTWGISGQAAYHMGTNGLSTKSPGQIAASWPTHCISVFYIFFLYFLTLTIFNNINFKIKCKKICSTLDFIHPVKIYLWFQLCCSSRHNGLNLPKELSTTNDNYKRAQNICITNIHHILNCHITYSNKKWVFWLPKSALSHWTFKKPNRVCTCMGCCFWTKC